MRVLAAPDKFKGTATAHEVAQAIGHACWELDIECIELPMADGERIGPILAVFRIVLPLLGQQEVVQGGHGSIVQVGRRGPDPVQRPRLVGAK